MKCRLCTSDRRDDLVIYNLKQGKPYWQFCLGKWWAFFSINQEEVKLTDNAHPTGSIVRKQMVLESKSRVKKILKICKLVN